MHALLPTAAGASSGSVDHAGDDRREANASVVLRSILDDGPVARSTIARRTGLSAAAVGRRCADLAALGLVRELPVRAPRGAVGRPHVPVDIDASRHLVCGVHVALPHTTVALLDLRGRVLAEDSLPHGDACPREILERAADRMRELLALHGAGRAPLGIGLATGGWVDPATGVIVWHNQLGWRDVPAGELLGRRSGLPVAVENHARALARAEQLFGDVPGRARQSLVQLFVGNMVDAAFATSGTVHHGPRSGAGDVAHLPVGDLDVRCPCGRIGCFQASVSDLTMGERAAAAGVVPRPSFDGLVAAARNGHPGAVELFRLRARLVGRAAAILLDVINPEVLVVAEGGLILLPELARQLLADLHAEISARSHVCVSPERTVVPSSFTPSILAVAAGAVVLDALYARPLELCGAPAPT
jgi:predicted NBD/HSP70 family sugar kinase